MRASGPAPVAAFRAVPALAALLGLFPVAAGAAPWSALHFPTGPSFNHALAVGDLDGDGRLDVANPNSQNSSVTVLLGHGDGTLAPFQSYPTYALPQDVAIADLTGDGIPDLATADYSSGGVTLLRGLGDGTFAPRAFHPAGAGLVAIVAVDLDGDGRRDLAVSRESGSKVVVLPALAGGGFGAPVESGTGSGPHQLGSADLDDDGRPDLAVVNFGTATASVHLGDGSVMPGVAMPYGCGPAPIGLSIADLDGDGDDDLVVSNVNAATVSVLRGDGSGGFGAPVAYPTAPRPRGMDVADLDGDAIPDLVIAAGYPDGDSVLTLYRGVGDGTLAFVEHIPLPYRAADCVIADMNGDGRRDIVATGPQAGVVSVLLNPGGPVAAPPSTPRSGLALAVSPHPARGAARFAIAAPGPGAATLEVFDPAGRSVARFGPLPPGERTLLWRAGGEGGAAPGAGLYFVRLSAGAAAVTRRLVVVR